jgi:hypothetical protein
LTGLPLLGGYVSNLLFLRAHLSQKTAHHYLLDLGNPKSHLALILGRLFCGGFAERASTAQFSLTPTRLTALVCQQTGLTYLLWREQLIFHQNH